ncbi:MAG: 30S ribosomal protein S4 [Parcubacteria group bacterium QH_9_35_7]|nr:MAG: 30S ribosomal protein S4 [Parcubacteria group bacterium QH_9_35_7]
MGRYTGPKNKIARKYGVNLGLKTDSSKVSRRLEQPPGEHGEKRKRGRSVYGRQLDEKQKAKFMYGVRENKFKNYFEKAVQAEGNTGIKMQELLERRLDNVVYRLGFAVTRAQARQFVNHGMFEVDGRSIDIPSYQVDIDNVIRLKENKRDKGPFLEISEQLQNADLPSWLSVDSTEKEGKVLHMPEEDDFEQVFDIKLIIEYYSAR